MQRKASGNTRGANADEKRFMAFVKQCDCIACRADGPSIVDHMYGSSFKHNKILVGMWALLPYCPACDEVKTILGRKAHDAMFGETQAEFYREFISDIPAVLLPPMGVIGAIEDWGK